MLVYLSSWKCRFKQLLRAPWVRRLMNVRRFGFVQVGVASDVSDFLSTIRRVGWWLLLKNVWICFMRGVCRPINRDSSVLVVFVDYDDMQTNSYCAKRSKAAWNWLSKRKRCDVVGDDGGCLSFYLLPTALYNLLRCTVRGHLGITWIVPKP